MISTRRALLFIVFAMISIVSLKTNYYIAVLSAAPVVLIFFTDLCENCGSVLFFQRGRTFLQWMNPLYVPDECRNCHHPIE